MPTKNPVPQTPESLRMLAAEAQEMSGQLVFVAEKMEEEEIAEVSTANFDQMRRALGYFNNFVRAAKQSLTNARLGVHKLAKESDTPPKKNTKKKGG